jgi:TonB-linked SusC/RagA family outer membrane protein
MLFHSKTWLVMRLTAVLLIAACLQVQAKGYGQNISLSVQNTSLENVLKKIKKQAGYHLVYREEWLNLGNKVTLDLKNVPVKDALDACFKNQALTYELVGKTIVVKKVATSLERYADKNNVEESQDIVITGRVRSPEGTPLEGVSVVVKGTQTGTTTNANGQFQLSVLSANNVELVFSFVGYATQTVKAGSRTVFDIILEEAVSDLTDVVVVGYGTVKKSDLTGSVAVISGKSLEDLPVSSIDQKLVGQVAGVQIQQVSGAPGAGTSVKIRGSGSLGAGNEPLYVIDGMPYSTGLYPNINPLTFINPNDIENITVLKDASSTAIYGSRGSNGVIMITTKKAKDGVSRISYSSSVGVQMVPEQGRPKMLNAKEFAQYQRNQIDYWVRLQANREPVLSDYPEEYRDLDALEGKQTDWYDLILQKGLIQDHNILIQKGFKNSGLQFGIGYFNQEGVVQYTGLKRYTANIGYNFNIGEKINIDLSLKPTYIDQDRALTGMGRDVDVTGISLWANPTMSPYDGNGDLIPFINVPKTIYGRANWDFPNPLFILRESKRNNKDFRNLGIAGISWKPLQGLILKSTISSLIRESKYSEYIPSTIGSSNNPPKPGRGKSNLSNTSTFDWLIENTLNYSKTVADNHSFNLLLGYSAQRSTDRGIDLNAGPYVNDLITTLNAASDITSWGESYEAASMVSYIGRLNYAYKGKYLFTSTFRSDGSSRFGVNKRFASFPSLAVAWKISDENFIQDIHFIDEMKLRASWGKSGNNNIGNYSHLPIVTLGQYVFNNTINSAATVGLFNPDLAWEESAQVDVGLEMSVLTNRLNFTVDYYKRRTNNMLMNDLIPAITGFNSQLVNKGLVQNSGWEIGINTKPLIGKFRWTANFNIAFNSNKVIKTNENGDRILAGNSDGRPSHVSIVGQPVGQFFGFILDGVYTQKEIEDPTVAKFPGAVAGNPKYRDIDGDGIITELLDFTVIGNPHPKFVFGFSNTFGYRNWDLMVNINGRYGGKVMNGMRQTTDNLQGYFNIGKEWVNRWINAENPGDGIHAGRPELVHRVNDKLWIEDGSYLRITNVTLGYNLSKDVTSRIGLQNGARLYITSQNLLTVTKYSGPNPEGQAQGINNTLAPNYDLNSYPIARIVSVGLNINF